MVSLVNRAPKLLTILVALVFVVIGLLGTFGDVFPDRVGIWSYVVATVVMILGIVFKGI